MTQALPAFSQFSFYTQNIKLDPLTVLAPSLSDFIIEAVKK